MGVGPVVAGPKLVPADPSDFQFDFTAPAGSVSFSIAMFKGSGTPAFAGCTLDDQPQALASPLTLTLPVGSHVIFFLVAIQSPKGNATAVIQEASTPTQNLKLVGTRGLAELRIKAT